MTYRPAALAVLGAIAMAAPTFAQGGTITFRKSPQGTDKLTFGAFVQGAEPNAETLKSKVVVYVCGNLEGFGLKSVNNLAAICKEIACEDVLPIVRLPNKASVTEAWCKANVPGIRVCQGGGYGRQASDEASWGIVFGQGGQEVYRGSIGEDFGAAIRKALKTMQPNLVEGLITKTVRKIADRAAKDKKYDKALKALKSHLKSKEARVQEEAQLLQARIERTGQRQLAQAQQGPKIDAVDAYKRLSDSFGKEQLGRKAAKARKALLRDPEVKREFKAKAVLKKVRRALAAVQKCNGCARPAAGGGGMGFSMVIEDDDKAMEGAQRLRCGTCRTANPQATRAVTGGFKKLGGKFSGTQAALAGQELQDAMKGGEDRATRRPPRRRGRR